MSNRLFHTNLSMVHHSVFFQMCKAHGIGFDIKVKPLCLFWLYIRTSNDWESNSCFVNCIAIVACTVFCLTLYKITINTCIDIIRTKISTVCLRVIMLRLIQCHQIFRKGKALCLCSMTVQKGAVLVWCKLPQMHHPFNHPLTTVLYRADTNIFPFFLFSFLYLFSLIIHHVYNYQLPPRT